jgi:hypothetical protein
MMHTFNVDTVTQLHAFIPFSFYRSIRNKRVPLSKIAKAKTDHSKNAAQYTYCIERDDSSSMHARKKCM